MHLFDHLHTVNTHRRWVRHYCWKLGLVRQGLTHDLSKYSPTEFWRSVKYYQGYRSPNDAERIANGVSLSWLHHKGRNRHHFEYWIDYCLREDGSVYIYYASSDTRLHVASTTIEQLMDYTFNTPSDPLRSADCVKQRCELISKNLSGERRV